MSLSQKLKETIKLIQVETERIMGNKKKEVLNCEKENRKLRKSIVTIKNIKKKMKNFR